MMIAKARVVPTWAPLAILAVAFLLLEWSRFHCSLKELGCSTARYAAGLRMPSAECGARVL